jgi:hypothetical protein
MLHKRPSGTLLLIGLSLLAASSAAVAHIPATYRITGVERVKQLDNYCGPAALTSVLRFHGKDITQETIGKAVYDPVSSSTNGADMLFFSREEGFAAYSWNSSINDVKSKIAAGLPVLVLQQNSMTDTSGHYRVLTGYDDEAMEFYVTDPYYDAITKLSYSQCEKLWKRMGYWALLVAPTEKDTFQNELGERNCVVHLDLSFANLKHRNYDVALREAQLALALEPGNTYAVSMLKKAKAGAGGR